MLQDTPGTASPAAVEAPTLACRQVWSRKIPLTGNMFFLLSQRNQCHSPPFAEYVQITSFCKVCPNLGPQMEQNYSHCGITFCVEMSAVPSASIPHSIPLSCPSWVSLKVCTSFSVTGGGGDHRPFSFTRILSICKGGAAFIDVSASPTGCQRMKKGGCGGIPSWPAPIPSLMSLVWFAG